MRGKVQGARPRRCTNFVLAASICCSQPPPTAAVNLHLPPRSSTILHHPPRTSAVQAVASTLGNGGTSRNHSPASREFLSTSTSNRSATRTTVAGRWRPTRMWSTDSLVFFSTVSARSEERRVGKERGGLG